MARASCGCSSRNSSQLRADRGLDHALDLRGHQLVLGLRGELRVRQLHRQDRGESLARIVAGGRDLFFLGGEFLLDVVVERARQRRAKAGEVRAAVLLRNVVGVAVHALLVGVVPLHRDFHLRVAVAGLEPEHRGMHRRLAAIQVSDEGLQAAVVLEHFGLVLALVDQLDAHAGVQERQLAQTLGEMS